MQMVTRMGLFGLGVPEIAVIAGVAVLIFGAATRTIVAQTACSALMSHGTFSRAIISGIVT